jgi:hypothetical protein
MGCNRPLSIHSTPSDSCKFAEPAGGAKKKSGGKQSLEQQLLGEAGSDIDDEDLEVSYWNNWI